MSNEEMRTAGPQPDWREQRARRRGEKDEKEEKEEEEKREEKGEKEEKWTRDPLGGIIWALILIAAGLILLIQSLGIVEWELFGGAWTAIFLAAGLILLLEVALRLVIPAYRRPVSGTLVFAFILLGIGLGGFFGWNVTGAVVLIAIGVAIILGGLLRGRF